MTSQEAGRAAGEPIEVVSENKAPVSPRPRLRFRGDGQPLPRPALPWVSVAPGVPYFMTEDGRPWHPIGQNDSVSWVELGPLFRRKDVATVDAHLQWLADHGVTCLRLMLEYAQVRHRYIEKPVGRFVPAMVQMWDDLFALCARHGLRILLTPVDTFWMWLHFKHHPYSAGKGGPLGEMNDVLLDPAVRDAIKARLSFVVERWGGSGAFFAWDLWNEIHPAQARDSAEPFAGFIADLSQHVRQLERRLYGRSHPQTVSLFGPELEWRAHMKMEEAIFRHPDLDFASTHIYEACTIDDPANTVDAARAMGRIAAKAIAEITDRRPFFDSEHGPIHRFKDHKVTLPADFDDEYFRHMQWAHLASGGAGGGMRWPNRRPHVLTPGMRDVQKAMAGFLPLIDWLRFERVTMSDDLVVRQQDGRTLAQDSVAAFGCASDGQALLYLLRRDTVGPDGRLDRGAPPLQLEVTVPGLRPGTYRVTGWDTRAGRPVPGEPSAQRGDGGFRLPPLVTDLAVAIRLTG